MFRIVQVETTNYCNSHCVFCPHDKYTHFEHMTDALYQKIVLDAAQYDLLRFIPMLNGEPFADPKIMERVAFAREHIKLATEIRLFTNGSLLTRKQVDELAMMRNVSLSISLNGSSRELRRDLMGLDDFDQVVDIIKYVRDKGLLYQSTTVWHGSLTMKEVNTLSAFPLTGVFSYHNYCGEIYPYTRTKATNCGRIHDNITVLADGTANLCCWDMFAKVKFGNARDMTLKELWDNPERQKYIEAHDKNEGQTMPMCQHCTQG